MSGSATFYVFSINRLGNFVKRPPFSGAARDNFRRIYAAAEERSTHGL